MNKILIIILVFLVVPTDISISWPIPKTIKNSTLDTVTASCHGRIHILVGNKTNYQIWCISEK